MAFALRVMVMLAAVMPLFAATAFHPAWWQTLIAAAIGSALGQLLVRFTRGRRIAAWSVIAVAAIVAIVPAAWLLTRGEHHDQPAATGILAVRSAGTRPSLTWDDLHAMQTLVPSVEVAVPYLRAGQQLMSEDANWNTQVVGTTPDYFQLAGAHFAAGHAFDASTAEKVVVLGETVVTQLYGAGHAAVGETVRIHSSLFTVVGVLAHRGSTAQGPDLDDVAIVPIEVYRSKIAPDLASRFSGVVLVSAKTPGDTARVKAELAALLRDRHGLASGDDDDFVIRDVPAL